MNETKREQSASEEQFPWLVALGALGMLVAVRRQGSKSPAEALQAVKDTLVGRLVVRDIRQAVKKARWPSTKRYKGAWIKDEWS